MNLGLYLHIPFCRQKCLYCDFPSYPGLEYLYSDYTAALCREISEQGGILSGTTVDTVFIGGGTPTLLPVQLLQSLLGSVRQAFQLTDDAEISIEANPGTVDGQMLQGLHEAGVNRISFGVQSFSDAVLTALGRIHTAEDALASVNMARSAGFSNINLDLMYGLPGQSLKQLEDSLRLAYRLNVQHLSVYGLKVEDGTGFARLAEQGLLNLPADDIDDAMYEAVIRDNDRQGFVRYEISNFAKTGCQCRHNLKYWHFQPYLGIGAAAHSFIDGQRRANFSEVPDYIQCIQSGRPPVAFIEDSDSRTAMAEFSFLALRTIQGMSVSRFHSHFNRDFFSVYQKVIERLESKGALRVAGDYVSLTALGMKFGNQVFAEFLQ